MNRVQALLIIAQDVAHEAVYEAIDRSGWENAPDLCESDWETVAVMAEAITPQQPPWLVAEAYKVLLEASRGSES